MDTAWEMRINLSKGDVVCFKIFNNFAIISSTKHLAKSRSRSRKSQMYSLCLNHFVTQVNWLQHI